MILHVFNDSETQSLTLKMTTFKSSDLYLSTIIYLNKQINLMRDKHKSDVN